MLLKLSLVLSLIALGSAKLHNAALLDNVANMVNSLKKETHNMNAVKTAPDQGHADSCKAKDPKFSLTWSPKTIELGTTITIHFDMTPVVDLAEGSVALTIWLTDYPDPIYEATQSFNCGTIHKMFPSYCPFKKGVKVSVPAYKFYVKPDLPLPGGSFKIRGSLTNKAGDLFVCMEAVLDIKHADYDDYYGY